MPLDTGAVASGLATTSTDEGVVALPSVAPRNLGETLRAARIAHGVSLEQIALITRIRHQHLAAIENMQVDQLPSRPFSIGYVRAYASALGMDPEEAAARFKSETPDPNLDQPLRAPVGVRAERHGGLKLVGVAVAVVGTAILGWNVAQHALASDSQARPASAMAVALAKVKPAMTQGPLTLGAPLPPPPEATTPQPYVTPGLEAPSGAGASAASAAEAAAPTDPADQAGAPFAAKGEVYGVPAAQSDVVLQATKAASVVIHGPDGSVYFARHLAAGEAYRAPRVSSLTITAPEPEAIRLYVGGALKGTLTAEETPLPKLGG